MIYAHEVDYNLFLGGARAFDRELEYLATECSVKHVVRCLPMGEAEARAHAEKHGVRSLLVIPIHDDPSEDIGAYLKSAVEFIGTALGRGEGVLVHCMMGISRSATVVIAYLMRTKNQTLDEALQHCRDRRPMCLPNHGFIRHLIKWEGPSCEFDVKVYQRWQPLYPEVPNKVMRRLWEQVSSRGQGDGDEREFEEALRGLRRIPEMDDDINYS